MLDSSESSGAMKTYQEIISDILEKKGRAEIDPRHIEGFMRVGHSTLDGLAFWQFEDEVEIGIGCIDACGIDSAEETAKSFNL